MQVPDQQRLDVVAQTRSNIYEDILVFRRLNSQPAPGGARQWASHCWEELIRHAAGEVLEDIQQAVANAPAIQYSLMFQRSPPL